ncbi:tetratricopeptide repeat protein [Flavilitoribacter nigricans]|uniref:Uncharacterized protein n=1 Tax=Flavilitoribacter nigricans (strain ATCC 23147 / DSM 23189 / NBRC 102662 / NCIMB 1420 / SS-2) TaxID=1122177 RepID=A0A2D0NIY8_FLAN2|nr:tetratricopeptide repeat protein [Flavilitoribacter nigricans]PHN08465.1 hypothetical protein CRP01_00700 [Flavilitoribacter nigricans DSM 23189 = NBRC 102662]
MKTNGILATIFFISNLLITPVWGQQNNTLKGNIRYLNSNKTPAVGVKIAGSIQTQENANVVYSTDQGEYALVFPNARDGYHVQLEVGDEDAQERVIEVVNQKELENCRIPALALDLFEIIVCRQGERDLIAQRYYNIIKTSSDLVLAKTKKELDKVLNEQEKNYQQIAELSARVSKLEEQTDSLTIYREAFRIASINKDDASDRILKYLNLLDEGRSIQEAREALSIEKAVEDLERSLDLHDAAIEELTTRANASLAIFDYDDAVECYRKIIDFSERADLNPVKLAEYYIGLATVYYDDGKFSNALDYQDKARELLEAVTKLHPAVLEAYNNVGNTLNALGRHQDALEYHTKAIELLEELDDVEETELAKAYNNIGLTYQNLAQYDEALKYQKKAIEIRERVLDSMDTELAAVYNNTATTYNKLGKYKEAIELFEKALHIQEQVLDPGHPHLSYTYNNIGITFQELGQYDQALEYELKALDIAKRALNANHPGLATTYENIGSIYQLKGELDKSLDYLKKTLEIREASQSAEEPAIGVTLGNMASVYYGLQQFEKALEYQQRSIDILLASIGPNHPDLINMYSTMGVIYQGLGDMNKALEYQLKNVELGEANLPENHPSLGISYYNIATSYTVMGDFERAMEYQAKSYNLFRNALPAGHPNTQEAFALQVTIYLFRANDRMEKKDYTGAMADLKKVSPYQNVWNMIGLCHYYMKHYPEAIAAYEKDLELDPTGKENQFYNNIGMAYAHNGQLEKAREAFTEYEKHHPDEGHAYRNWAMYYALQKDREKALEHLQKAIDMGYNNLDWIKTDDSMDILRKKKEFKEIIAQLEAGN